MLKNDKIRFSIKLVLALLPIIIFIGYVLLCPMCYMDIEYPSWQYTKNYVRSGNEDADIIILGDSRAMADIIPEVIAPDRPCVNLAVGGATPIEMYYFYVSYLQNHPAAETAVVMFAPFHYTYMDNYKTRTLYFNALRLRDYQELLKMALYYNSESVLFPDHSAYHLSCALRLPDVYLPAIYNSRFIGRRKENNERMAELIKSKGQGYFGTDDYNDDLAYEASYTQMEVNGDSALIEFYADALFTLLSNSCKNVILVQPPVNEATYNSLNDNYVREYTQYIDNLCRNHENISYSPHFVKYENQYFGDSSHLNERGANKYSQEFRESYARFLDK